MTKEERKELELDFVDMLGDTLGVVKACLEHKHSGAWLLDGGLGEFLTKAGKTYDIIMNVEIK